MISVENVKSFFLKYLFENKFLRSAVVYVLIIVGGLWFTIICASFDKDPFFDGDTYKAWQNWIGLPNSVLTFIVAIFFYIIFCVLFLLIASILGYLWSVRNTLKTFSKYLWDKDFLFKVALVLTILYLIIRIFGIHFDFD